MRSWASQHAQHTSRASGAGAALLQLHRGGVVQVARQRPPLHGASGAVSTDRVACRPTQGGRHGEQAYWRACCARWLHAGNRDVRTCACRRRGGVGVRSAAGVVGEDGTCECMAAGGDTLLGESWPPC